MCVGGGGGGGCGARQVGGLGDRGGGTEEGDVGGGNISHRLRYSRANHRPMTLHWTFDRSRGSGRPFLWLLLVSYGHPRK
jgi:hypothetical protein